MKINKYNAMLAIQPVVLAMCRGIFLTVEQAAGTGLWLAELVHHTADLGIKNRNHHLIKFGYECIRTLEPAEFSVDSYDLAMKYVNIWLTTGKVTVDSSQFRIPLDDVTKSAVDLVWTIVDAETNNSIASRVYNNLNIRTFPDRAEPFTRIFIDTFSEA